MTLRHFTSRTALLALAVALPAVAGQADICYGPATSLLEPSPPSNATVFTCPQAGNLTLPQLAAAGWSVVQMVPVQVSANTQAVQLVIQRP